VAGAKLQDSFDWLSTAMVLDELFVLKADQY
jgi:hypothetical protein